MDGREQPKLITKGMGKSRTSGAYRANKYSISWGNGSMQKNLHRY